MLSVYNTDAFDFSTPSQDIIVAISTAPGMGAIAVIRLSGEGCLALTQRLFFSPSGKQLTEAKANSILFGEIRHNNQVVDEVLVSVFHAPHSFTGEESIEISCHGSTFIQQQIVELLLHEGARLAQPGEFTRRAFQHGKFDLSQAEAVADLISSTSQASHRVAMNQMRGGFARKLVLLRDKLLQFVSLIELELDFSEEDVEFANRTHLMTLTETIEEEITTLAQSFKMGNAIKNGIPVAIIGETNAGKSTLLNALLNEEKAIVSDIHGTTRDVIEDTTTIAGTQFRFIDTAGIRNTTDVIESLGIERTFQKLSQASIVLWLIDGTQPVAHINEQIEQIAPKLGDKKAFILVNKTDLLDEQHKQTIAERLKTEGHPYLFISAHHNIGIDTLQQHLVEAAAIPSVGEDDVIINNLRHYEALNNALEAIVRVKNGLHDGITSDFLSQDIRECMHFLGEITGQISTEEVLGSIFSKFCIGK